MNQPAANVALRDDPPLVPATGSGPAPLLSMIERAARDPSFDLDRLERLMGMHQDMQRREAERLFNEAMSACQAELPRVIRAATNTHNNSRYAKLEDIAKVSAPIYTRHGFSLSFDTEDGAAAGFVRLVCKVAHAAGFSRDVRADLPLDAAGSQGKANKTGIQAWGSTMSYGRRYLTLLVFNIALTNDPHDNDGVPAKGNDEPEFITDAQACELRALVRAHDVNLDAFLAYGQVASIEEIPAGQFQSAKAQLLRKAKPVTKGGRANG